MTSRTKPKPHRPRRYCPSSLTHPSVKPPKLEIDRGRAWYVAWTVGRARSLDEKLVEAGFAVHRPAAASRYLFVGLTAREPEFGELRSCLGGEREEVLGFTYRDGDVLCAVPRRLTTPPRYGRLLTTRNGPLRVPPSFIVEFDEVATARAAEPRFKAGQRVRPIAGAWVGFVAEVEASNDKCVRGLLDLFGRKTVVEFDPGQLEAA